MIPVPSLRTDPGKPVEDGACPACPHALAAHDRISLRFCRASAAHAASRGCVCPAV